MALIRHEDGTVHFSLLKAFDRSPAHYRVACETPFEATREMRIGTAVHFLVLGAREGKTVVKYPGKERKGSAWQDFAEEHRGHDILTIPEWQMAEQIAAVINADAVAAPYLKGRREAALRWDDDGMACATDGVDVIGDGFLGDLKITHSSKPATFMRTATNLFYHAQMAFYETGAIKNGIDVSKGLFLIAAESKPPHSVTVFRLPPATVQQGRKSCAIWLEQLRACEENDHFPGYVQNVVDFDLPAWMGDAEEDADAEERAPGGFEHGDTQPWSAP